MEVVTRVEAITPYFVLNDSTAKMSLDPEKSIPNSEIIEKGKYHRFVFQINQYNSEGFIVVRVERVSPKEVLTHKMQTVVDEMYASEHQNLIGKVKRDALKNL